MSDGRLVAGPPKGRAARSSIVERYISRSCLDVLDNPLAMFHAAKVQGASRDRRPGFSGKVH
jgi:hypothetical protein